MSLEWAPTRLSRRGSNCGSAADAGPAGMHAGQHERREPLVILRRSSVPSVAPEALRPRAQ
jgi:hypothetical protein